VAGTGAGQPAAGATGSKTAQLGEGIVTRGKLNAISQVSAGEGEIKTEPDEQMEYDYTSPDLDEVFFLGGTGQFAGDDGEESDISGNVSDKILDSSMELGEEDLTANSGGGKDIGKKT
jgi:hypothetical protein